MAFDRASGVLMHITSLPSPHGIGTLGQAAFDFVDFLRDAGQRYWQVLPLGHTGFGDSPYQCYSAAAGNPLLIDLDKLVTDSMLTADEVRAADLDWNPDKVDYVQLIEVRYPLLRRAYTRAKEMPYIMSAVQAFRTHAADWVEDYALFMALKEERFDGAPLWEWTDTDLLHRDAQALSLARQQLKDEIDFRVFLQAIFFAQWGTLRAYAAKSGVRIIGDIPIYVSPDSSDVWQHPTLFQVDADCKPKKVAGVPPDYYSATGQLWGNPVYAWKEHEKTGYAWWIWRLRQNADLFDVIRIDHFRGFEAFWEVDADEETAIKGAWRKGPGMKLFRALENAVPELPIIAEDLGVMTDKVKALLRSTGFPGMRVMIFGFNRFEDNDHLPHNYPVNSIVYTSTHDSQSICEQILDLCEPDDAAFAKEYIRWDAREPLAWSAIRTLFASPACIAMTTMQDLLSLGADARMNVPATLGGNWAWRVRREGINADVAAFLRRVTDVNRRLHPLPEIFAQKPLDEIELCPVKPDMDYGARRYWTDVQEQYDLLLKANAFFTRFEP